MIIDLLEPKNSENFRLNFLVYEHIGCEIILASDIALFMHDPNINRFKIRERSGIKDGDEIVVWPGYKNASYATVLSYGDTWIASVGEHSGYLLNFDRDDRGCWVATVACNFKALERVVFNALD